MRQALQTTKCAVQSAYLMQNPILAFQRTRRKYTTFWPKCQCFCLEIGLFVGDLGDLWLSRETERPLPKDMR